MGGLGGFLQDLVHPRIFDQAKLEIEGKKWIMPDGVVCVELKLEGEVSHLPICTFSEVKNEVGVGVCDPALQCQLDYVKVYSSEKVSILSNALLLV